MGERKKNYDYLIDKKFGKIKVICESDIRSNQGHVCMLCKCECGNEKIIPCHYLNITLISCGCWKSGKERMFATFMNKIEKTDDCWIWKGKLNKVGYGRHNHRYAHQLSFEYHNGIIPEDKMICHTCNNKQCVNPKHLYAGTAKDSAQDAIRDGVYIRRSLTSKRWKKE